MNKPPGGHSGTNLTSTLTAGALADAAAALLAVVQALGGAAAAPAGPAPENVFDLVNECIMSKAHSNRRVRYLLQLRSSWKLFADVFGDRAPGDLSAVEIEQWMDGRGLAPRTRRNYLVDLRTLFSFAVARGYVPKNPLLAIDLPIGDDVPPSIHTPDQVERILRTAQLRDVDVMRLLAVQYFAGLRPSEAEQLTEAELSPAFIEVKAARSKSRQRRLVAVNDTLAAWLAVGGVLPVVNHKRRWLAVRRAAGVPWAHDVTRHSFASYHLAAHRSQDSTATELGHRSSYMLFRHYRALVTGDQAKAFWGLRPRDVRG